MAPVADVGQVCVVYIVDNDASVRRSLSRLMRANGFEVKCISSPQQLADEMVTGEQGCVVLDMTMSVTIGAPLKARLKEMKFEMPIIATSVRDDATVREDAHRIGAKFFLSKPVDTHALLDTIAWVAETKNDPDEVKRDPDDPTR